MLPELAETRLGLGAKGLGWMHAAQAGGGLVIGGLIFLLPQRRSHVVPFAASLICLGTALIVLAQVQGLAATLLVLAVISAMITAWDIFTQSMMQLSVSDGQRGRAMGTWVFAIGSAPLGHLEIGFLATAIGTDWALSLNGMAVVAVIAVALAITPALRRL